MTTSTRENVFPFEDDMPENTTGGTTVLPERAEPEPAPGEPGHADHVHTLDCAGGCPHQP